MTTFGDLIDSVYDYLSPAAVGQDRVTTLTADISASATQVNVAVGQAPDRGLIEIGQELMAVQSFSSNTGVVTLHPWGRGQRGTAAVPHAANSKVTISPRFPRSTLARSIRNTVHGLYPSLFWAKTDESLTLSAARLTYPLPADAESVIAVTSEEVGPSRRWARLARWAVDTSADPTDFPSGKSLDLYEGFPGRPLRVVYRARFGALVDEATTLESVGLTDRWIDLVAFSVTGNLLLSTEALRLQSDAVETQERAGSVTPTQATQVARQYLGMYKARLAEERAALREQYPPTVTRQP